MTYGGQRLSNAQLEASSYIHNGDSPTFFKKFLGRRGNPHGQPSSSETERRTASAVGAPHSISTRTDCGAPQANRCRRLSTSRRPTCKKRRPLHLVLGQHPCTKCGPQSYIRPCLSFQTK